MISTIEKEIVRVRKQLSIDVKLYGFEYMEEDTRKLYNKYSINMKKKERGNAGRKYLNCSLSLSLSLRI